jgi:hypothetical protein
MQKLKVLVPMAGIDVSYSKGDVAEFDDAEAARLIAAGHCEAIEEPAEHGHQAEHGHLPEHGHQDAKLKNRK